MLILRNRKQSRTPHWPVDKRTPAIQLSVALVTRNRPAPLRRCLESLRAQNVQPFELVVSDDSDPRFALETRAVTEQWGGRYLTGPRRGLYANRNQAAIACQGTHIRTMDDDHTFPDGHLALCLDAVREDPRSIWTVGETSFIEGRPHATAETANQLHPSGLGTRVENPDDNWAIADGSTTYPRIIFDAGFRLMEEFGFGSSYLEFGALLYHHGFRSRCLRGAAALVEHHANWGTILRSHDPAVRASHLYASLCYNFCFRPNPARAWRYALANLWNSRLHLSLAVRLPEFVEKARLRWGSRIPMPVPP